MPTEIAVQASRSGVAIWKRLIPHARIAMIYEGANGIQALDPKIEATAALEKIGEPRWERDRLVFQGAAADRLSGETSLGRARLLAGQLAGAHPAPGQVAEPRGGPLTQIHPPRPGQHHAVAYRDLVVGDTVKIPLVVLGDMLDDVDWVNVVFQNVLGQGHHATSYSL